VLLIATREAYAASPFSQIIEVAETNRRLMEQVQLDVYPQLLLRMGRAPAASAVPPPAAGGNAHRDILNARCPGSVSAKCCPRESCQRPADLLTFVPTSRRHDVAG
jgi:hypothetical protein